MNILEICTLFVTFVVFKMGYSYYAYDKYYKPINNKDIHKESYCFEIARKTIVEQCQDTEIGLCAGEFYYKDLWTRDAFFGCMGLLTLGEYKLVEKVLYTLKRFQRKDGLIPLRVGNNHYGIRFLFGIDLGDKVAVYEDDKAFKEPSDSNSQFIVLTYLLYKLSNDLNVLKKFYEPCMKAFNHNLKNIHGDKLLHGEYFDTWHDTFTVNGASLFSNVFMLKSMECMSNINKALSKPYVLNTLNYNNHKKSFIDKFWNGKFLKIYPHMDYLETAGNALAILFDIIDREKASSILIHMENNNKKPMLPVVLPELPSKYIYKPLYLIGLQDYHNRHFWPWVNGLMKAACNHVNILSGTVDKAFKNVEDIMYKYGKCYERIDPKTLGPVRHFFQSSEINFSESAGMYLLAKEDNVF
tara:strand:- start:2454 stop:3689 length:1236 start_codon:yes stop_codon:yes gene_type:complete